MKISEVLQRYKELTERVRIMRETPIVDNDFPENRERADHELRRSIDFFGFLKPEDIMHDLSFTHFQSANEERCRVAFGHDPRTWTPEQWACAIAGEAGELCNLVKKVFRGDFTLGTKREDILEEIADVIHYCDLMITALDGDTEVEIRKKFNKVSIRRNCHIRL